MTRNQYRREIAALGLNQVQAAAFFRVSARTSRVWAADGAPEWVEIITTIMKHYGVSVEDVNRLMTRK